MVELPTRQTEGDARRIKDVAWREKLRAEDVAWREKVRVEDLSEREAARAEREAGRVEDVAWRTQARAEDRAERNAFHAQTLQCLARGLAFLAAAHNAKPDTPTEELARRARDFTQWISGVDGTTDQDT